MINYSGFPEVELNAHHSRTSVNKLGENLTLEWQTLKKNDRTYQLWEVHYYIMLLLLFHVV